MLCQAGSLEFSERIFDAFDDSHNIAEALSDLSTAKELATNPSSLEEVKAAIALYAHYSGENGQGELSPSDSDEIRSHLQSALRKDRVKLGTTNASTIESMKRYLLAEVFPDQKVGENALQLRFENISDADAMSLIGLYHSDPRSLRYDQDVAEIITGVSENPKKAKAVFLLPPVILEGNSTEEAHAVEETLNQDFNKIASQEMPVLVHAATIGGKLTVNIEVKGYQYASYAQTLLRTLFTAANGNRYLFKLANVAETGSDFFTSVNWLGMDQLNALSLKSARTFTTIENALRSQAVSGRWYNPDENTVIKHAQALRDLRVKHMQANLERDVKLLKSSDAPPETIAARESKTATWIANQDHNLARIKQTVTNAVRGLKSSPAFATLSREQQANEVLKTAKEASGIKFIPTLSWAVVFCSTVVSSYYAVEWVLQAHREKDPVLRQQINERYGSQLAASLLYLVPVAGEAEIAYDAGGFLLEHGARALNFDLKIPRTSDLILRLTEHAGDPILWYRHINRMQMFITNELVEESVPMLPTQIKTGEYVDFFVLKVRQARMFNEDIAQTKQKLLTHVKQLGQKYLLYSYVVSNKVGGHYNRDADDFFWQNTKALTTPGNGYFDIALSEILHE